MTTFNRKDYEMVYTFARNQYYWHESTGRGFDLDAAHIMHRCEEVLGRQSDFPPEARQRLKEDKRKTRK